MLLKINNLTIKVDDTEQATIVSGVNLSLQRSSITALVGASGSGKSTTAMAILNLLSAGLRIAQGEIIFDGIDVLKLKARDLRKIRGGQVGMVFQEPLYAFNPVFSIGYQIDEVLRFHTKLRGRKKRERVYELLDLVGLPEPKQAAGQFPHQFSGGMRQRAMIAQAIAANPKLIIADEPTSNLDVTLQAKIMELFKKLRKELDLSILLITHDLGMVAHLADHVHVMNQGRVIESGVTSEIIKNPKEEYTRELLA